MRPKLAILHAARGLGLFALARRLTQSEVRILCYHGGCIGDENAFNPKLFLSEQTFRRRMEWLLAQGYQVIGLDELQAAGPARAPRVVLTFDDGWYSTAERLLPVLSSLGLPSSLYLSTNQFLQGRPIVQVALRYLLWKTRLEHARIDGCGADVDGSYDLRRPEIREQLLQRAIAAGKLAADRAAAVAMLERFAACLGIAKAEFNLASRRFDYVGKEDLLRLAAQGCKVEAHGHVHRYPKGDPVGFAADLGRCMDAIEAMGLPRPRHYCYPSGNFDGGASAVLEEAGIVTATTCQDGLAEPGRAEGYHYLPRYLDGENVTALEFEAELSGFAALVRRHLLAPLSALRASLGRRRGRQRTAQASTRPAL